MFGDRFGSGGDGGVSFSGEVVDGGVPVPLDWGSLKLEALERDGYVCVECGSCVSDGDGLAVVWVENPDEAGFGVDNLVTVCGDDVGEVQSGEWDGGVVDEMVVGVGEVPEFAREGVSEVGESESGDGNSRVGNGSEGSVGGSEGVSSSGSGSVTFDDGGESESERVLAGSEFDEDGDGGNGSVGGAIVADGVVEGAFGVFDVLKVVVLAVLSVISVGGVVQLVRGEGVSGAVEWASFVVSGVGSVWFSVGLAVVGVVGSLLWREYLVGAWPDGGVVVWDDESVEDMQVGGAIAGGVVGAVVALSVSPLVSFPVWANVMLAVVWVVAMVAVVVGVRDLVLVESQAGREHFGWVWDSFVRVPPVVFVTLALHPAVVSPWVFSGLAVVPGVVAGVYAVVQSRRGEVGSGNVSEFGLLG